MLDHLLHAIELSNKYAAGLVHDVPDDRMAAQPVPGQTLNHPAWVLGHVAVSNDGGAMVLGGARVCPESWESQFVMGSTPLDDRAAYPDKATLLDHVHRSSAGLVEQLRKATPEQLQAPGPAEMIDWFPTIGDFVIYDVTTHIGTHLGQLSAWRRAMGLPALF